MTRAYLFSPSIYTFHSKCFTYSQKCYGAKMKGFHIINCPAYAHNIINFAKSIMKGKLAKRVYIHKTLKELHEHIPINCLPKEYGGNMETCSQIAGACWLGSLKIHFPIIRMYVRIICTYSRTHMQ